MKKATQSSVVAAVRPPLNRYLTGKPRSSSSQTTKRSPLEYCSLGVNRRIYPGDPVPPAASGGQEAYRFRQGRQKKQCQQDRYEAANVKHRRPAKGGNELGTNRPAQHRAERPSHGDESDQDRTHPPRRIFGYQRDHVGNRSTHTDAGQKAKCGERRERIRPRSCQAEYTEYCDGDNDLITAAVPIGKRRQYERAERESDRSRCENGAKGGYRNCQIAGNGSGDKGNGLRVEPVEQHDKSAQDEYADLKAAYRILIDDVGNIYIFAGHSLPRRLTLP